VTAAGDTRLTGNAPQVLVLTTYRMLISDIARFIIVYIVLLVGFATSMFVLFESAKSGQEEVDFEPLGASNALRLADLGSVTFPLQKRTDVAEFLA